VGLFSLQYRLANVCVLITDYTLIKPQIMRLLEKSSQLAREYRTEVRVAAELLVRP
jgi:hypothetical protein